MNLILVTLFIIATSVSCAKHESNRNIISKKLKPTSTARNASNFKHWPKPKAEKPKLKYSKPKTEGPETNYYPSCVPAANLSRKGTWIKKLSKLPPFTVSHRINFKKPKYLEVFPIGSKRYLYLLIENFSTKQIDLVFHKGRVNINIPKLYEDLKGYVSKPYLRKKIVRFFTGLKHFKKIAGKRDTEKRTYFSDNFEITEEYSDLYELKFQIHLCEIGESLYSSLLPSLPNDTLDRLARLIMEFC
ncbi:hypothetical protein Anas_05882 [Armadillidium nasatum]|uniref:Protein takeout n=1 Tax=Armadillidium nasatum TaxID=96803 RepID=A0A5N5TAN5_9CRUS|nr:hypothetical protein Anas_05882 [Armadillidium nasatum]